MFVILMFQIRHYSWKRRTAKVAMLMMMEMSTAETRGDEWTIAPSSTAADLSVIVLRLEGREASEVILSCIKLKLSTNQGGRQSIFLYFWSFKSGFDLSWAFLSDRTLLRRPIFCEVSRNLSPIFCNPASSMTTWSATNSGSNWRLILKWHWQHWPVTNPQTSPGLV